MPPIIAEWASYQELVKEMGRALNEGTEPNIKWSEYTSRGEKFYRHSFLVADTAPVLKEMGFLDKFTYDLKHFQDNMFSDGQHAHSMSMEDMLMLPELINNPVAILSERTDTQRQDNSGHSYGAVIFLCQSNSNPPTIGNQKYYIIAVQPKDHHDDLLNNRYTSKILSYYSLDHSRFYGNMGCIVRGTRDVLYFDQKQYNAIASKWRIQELCNYPSTAVPINGHYTTRGNLERTTRTFEITRKDAIHNQLKDFYYNQNDLKSDTFPLFKDSLDVLKNPQSSYKALQIARETIRGMCVYEQNQAIANFVRVEADKLFAQAYVRNLERSGEIDRMSGIVKRALVNIPVNSAEDLKCFIDIAANIGKSVPTLENMGVVFSQASQNTFIGKRANLCSKDLEKQTSECLDNVIASKALEFARQVRTQQKEISSQLEMFSQTGR